MVAIIEGRDPSLVEDPYASTQSRNRRQGDIEPPARAIHIVSEPVPMPPSSTEEPKPEEPKPEEPKPEEPKPEEPKPEEPKPEEPEHKTEE